MMKASNHPLFHQCLKIFKEHNITHKKLLLACSGGLDSTVLLDLTQELCRPLKLKLAVAYVKHGKDTYRNQAQCFVEMLSTMFDLPFFSNRDEVFPKKKSQEAFRKFRFSYFNKWMKEEGFDFLILAHTADDLLETRIFRLIRGTGGEGLKSMGVLDPPIFRPFLNIARKQIQNYALKRGVQWIEDPSNSKTQFLRNWIRHCWLKDIENKRPGSIKNMALSLERLSCMQNNLISSDDVITQKGLSRKKLQKMSVDEKKKWIAFYIKSLKIKNYKESHIQEIIKNLKKTRTRFFLLKRHWTLSPDWITTSKN